MQNKAVGVQESNKIKGSEKSYKYRSTFSPFEEIPREKRATGSLLVVGDYMLTLLLTLDALSPYIGS